MISLIKESVEPGEPLEVCCFCRNATAFWSNDPTRASNQQVACCESCAKVANPADLPTKLEWFRRETIVWEGRRSS